LLREQLNVSLEPQVFSIAERENFELGGLDRYGIEQAMLQEFLANSDSAGSFERCAARGILPHGAAGQAAYQNSEHSLKRFVNELGRFAVKPSNAESRLFERRLDDCLLSAAITIHPETGLVHMRHAAIKPFDFIRIWLEYLMCSVEEKATPTAVLAGLDPKKREQTLLWQFDPVEDSDAVLKRLIALYYEGRCRPLPFMPQASFVYADALRAGKTAEQARAAAAQTLVQSDFTRSDLDDLSFARFFNETIVESPDFDRCAREVFGPILQHRKKSE